MDIKAKLDEKIKQFEDYKKQIMDLNKAIGALQEQGQAIHMAAMEVRGGIDTLAKLLAEQEADANKAKAALILPDKTLVAADGQTPIAKVEESTPVAQATTEADKPATVLEVK